MPRPSGESFFLLGRWSAERRLTPKGDSAAGGRAESIPSDKNRSSTMSAATPLAIESDDRLKTEKSSLLALSGAAPCRLRSRGRTLAHSKPRRRPALRDRASGSRLPARDSGAHPCLRASHFGRLRCFMLGRGFGPSRPVIAVEVHHCSRCGSTDTLRRPPIVTSRPEGELPSSATLGLRPLLAGLPWRALRTSNRTGHRAALCTRAAASSVVSIALLSTLPASLHRTHPSHPVGAWSFSESF